MSKKTSKYRFEPSKPPTEPVYHTRRNTLLSLSSFGAALTSPWLAHAQTQGFDIAAHTDADIQTALRLRDLALTDTLPQPQTAYKLIESLCTEVGPRPAGSAGDAAAVAWALRNATLLGLVAKAEPVEVTTWQRGEATATLHIGGSNPSIQPLVMAALGNSIGTPPDGLDAELVYYPNFQALKADSSGKAFGKLVFVDERTERSRDGQGYGRAVLARLAGAVEAARKGAVAYAIRSIGTSADRIAHTGAMRYERQVRQVPAIAVSVPDANVIARLHERGTPMRLRLNMNNADGPKTMSANVLAELPGTDLAQEIVQIGAHLDSWDTGQGALDDASGVGIVLAAAALIQHMQLRPRRTIRVVLFANEENGFDGANAYAALHKNEVHQLVSESDFGAANIWRMASRVNPAALGAINNLAHVLKPLGIDAAGNQGNPGPDAGVLMRTNKWPALGLTQDGTAYFDVHHTPNDTIERVDPATLPQNVAAWAATAWLASQSRVPFGPIAL